MQLKIQNGVVELSGEVILSDINREELQIYDANALTLLYSYEVPQELSLDTQMVFGDFLDGSEKNLNAFIAAYGDLVQQGVLNIGQQMDKIKNTVNGFYEKSIE